jgi:hypothetical protein
MKDRGLGTPATRAAILERIIWTESNPSGYITRGPEGEKGKKADNKHLYPTERAMKFMSLLPDKLKEPATTGEWEFELAQIQKGLKEKEAFLTGIEDFVRELVNYEKTHKRTPQEMAVFSVKVGGGDILCNCPICGSPVVSYQYTKDKTGKKLAKAISGYRCSSSACKLRVPRICGGKKLTDAQMKKLITTGSAGVIENFFSESKNRYYSAEVILERDETGMYTGKAKMVFPDKEIKEILCKCPLCGDNIVPFKYTKNVSSATGKLMPKTYQGWKCANRQCNLDALFNPVAQKMLTAEQAKSLFTKGETETLQGFVSAKGKKFEAKLLLAKDENGHYTGAKDFVFPPRPPRQSNSSQQAINPDEVICDCPNCGEGKIVPFKYTSKMDGAVKHCFHCSNRSCTLKPIYVGCNGHKWKKEELVKLYTLGKTGTITDFVSKKTGKTYSARIAANRDKDNRIIATEYDFLWN